MNQKKMFKNWIGTSRYVYNRSLKATKEGEKMNFFELRNKYVTAKDNPLVQEWELETPKDIRAGAINDMVKAYKTAISNLKNNNIQKFNLQYRKKKKESSIVIPSSAIKFKDKKMYIYKTYTKEEIKLSKDKCLKNIELKHDCRLKNDNGKWFLFVPLKIKLDIKTPEKEICSLDPGTRKFQTIYSEEVVIKIELKKEKLKKLQTKLDFLQSLRSKKIIRKSCYNKKNNKLQFRVKNLIDEIHNQTINYLTNTFKTIFIPEFESQEILKINRSKKFRRNLLSLRHFHFKEKLKAKSKLKNGCTGIVCTEEYTSKTCGQCGCIVNIGSNEVFNCNVCFLKIDRDINGARNILIKQLKN